VGCPREGLETARRDRSATVEARPEGPVVESGECGVDERQLPLGPLAECQVPLLLEHLRRRRGLRPVRHLARCLDRVADVGEQPRALGFEGGSDRGRIDGLHGRTVRSEAPDCTRVVYSRGVPEETLMATEIDPVCGMQVDTTTSLLSFEYKGTTYWFCSKGCLLEFQDDPEKYLDESYTPSM
jgi:YHS domain-containing protein